MLAFRGLSRSRLLSNSIPTGFDCWGFGDGGDGLSPLPLDTAVVANTVKPAALDRVTVDTDVQGKAIAHLMDSRLLEIHAPLVGQCRQGQRHRVQADS